jgi:protein-disulfide isomerase
MEENNKEETKKIGGSNFLSISIIIAAVLISGSILYTKNPNNLPKQVQQAQTGQINPSQPAAEPAAPANLNEVLKINNEDVILGDPNAKITLVEYGDYECPFCKKFFEDTGLALRKNYIETGKVKMIYRDFPLPFHPQAMPAALAANCAKEQGKFWLYHDELFKNQEKLNSLDYVKLAQDLGLNTETFKSCFENKKYLQKIQKDYGGGQSIGVNGTPTFFINGKQIVGAQPYSAFEQIIEQELKSQ